MVVAYLWCHELWSTAECACRSTIVHILLTETVVCQLDVAVKGQEDVVELQISVDDALAVQVLQSKQYFCSVEARSSLGESAFLDVHHQISTLDVFHAENNPISLDTLTRMKMCLHEVDSRFSLEA